MQPVKFAPIALSMIIALGFGSVAFAQESKTNVNKATVSTIQKNNKNVKTPQKETTPQQKCRWIPGFGCI